MEQGYSLKSLLYNSQRKFLFPLAIIFSIGFVNNSTGQHISAALDSIHRLDDTDYKNIHLYDSLFDHYKKVKNYTQLGSDAHQLAKWLPIKEAFDKKIEVISTAVEAKKRAKPYNAELLKRSYANLGSYHKLNGNYTKSIQIYLKMLAVKGSTKFNDLANKRLGNLYFYLKDYYKAIEYYKIVLDLYDDTTPIKDRVLVHRSIASFYENLLLPQYDSLIKYHLLKSDSLNNTLKNKIINEVFLTKLGLANLYLDGVDQDLQKSKLYYQQALIYAKQIENEKENYSSSCYHNLGLVYKDQDSLDIAKRYFLKSLAYKRVNSNHHAYLSLGSLEGKRKNYDASQQYFQEALSKAFGYNGFNKPIDSITVEEIKTAKYKKEVLKVFTTRMKVLLTQLEEEKQLVIENSMLKTLELSDISLDDLASKDTPFKTKLSKIKVSIFKTLELSDILLDYIASKDFSFKTKLSQKDSESNINLLGLEACYKFNNLEKAFYFMEKNKAVLLLQDIEEQKRALPPDVITAKRNKEKEIERLENQLLISWGATKDSLSNSVKENKEKFTQYTDSIAIVYPKYASYNRIPEILKIQDVTIPKDELIIQYAMSEISGGEIPETYIMIMSDGYQKLFKLDDVALLLERITKLRLLLNQPFKISDDLLVYKRTAHELYLQLFPEEIRNKLAHKKVRIIPDHVLGMIPFEALITDIETTKYLIEDTEINYAYSLSFLKENASIERTTDQDFLGIAPINFKNGLTPLKNSGKEVVIANGFYKGDVLIDEEATKDNYRAKAAKYRVLHLATHADAADTDTIQPWIAFTKEKLTDLELNTIKNNADLVVLSSCNTSLGDVKRGEGALSLARSFFKSGAKSVIPSLWSTNDKAMATITSDFYDNLSEGQTKSAALRAAKLTYLNANTDAEASPHYWAPLILIGDNGVLLPTPNYDWVLNISVGFIGIFLFLIVYRKIRSEKDKD